MTLPRAFFERNACTVARHLLGAQLVREVGGQRITARIVETEAYTGQEDAASHSHRGKTDRNAPMWEAPGFAYLYLIYGRYWLLNVTCEPYGHPAAVLIRAVEPLSGESLIAQNRQGVAPRQWTNGPGRLTMALGIDGTANRTDLTQQSNSLWLTAGDTIPDEAVCNGARIGLGKAVSEPWLSMARRWWIRDNPHVS